MTSLLTWQREDPSQQQQQSQTTLELCHVAIKVPKPDGLQAQPPRLYTLLQSDVANSVPVGFSSICQLRSVRPILLHL